MKQKMGLLLVAIGIFCLGCGGYLILQSIIENRDKTETYADGAIVYEEPYILEDSLRQEKYQFENYVSSMLSHYHSLLEWKNGGIQNARFKKIGWHPDLLVELDLYEDKHPFAIECEWLRQFTDDQVTWAEAEKLEACLMFASQQDMKVFIAIGVGGSAEKPADVYIVPAEVAKTTLTKAFLKQYKREDNEAPLYYDTENRSLY